MACLISAWLGDELLMGCTGQDIAGETTHLGDLKADEGLVLAELRSSAVGEEASGPRRALETRDDGHEHHGEADPARHPDGRAQARDA